MIDLKPLGSLVITDSENGVSLMVRMNLPENDAALLDLLRQGDGMTVAELSMAMGVTATAVRQRLTRLQAGELIERETIRAKRGRPSHRYVLTEKGRRQTGANFADLAIALWREIGEIRDTEIRRGLLKRISARMAEIYDSQIEGEDVATRMEAVAELFRERSVPFTVDGSQDLPVLTALACPYPELAEQDRTICAMERMLFSEVLGEPVKLSQCRLDGEPCCTFELNKC